MLRKNNLRFGVLVGLVIPFIGVVAFYFVKFYPTFSFAEYFRAAIHNKSLLTAVSCVSLLLNVAVFTFYINRKLDNTAKGIFLITCLYMLAVLVFKLFLNG